MTVIFIVPVVIVVVILFVVLLIGVRVAVAYELCGIVWSSQDTEKNAQNTVALHCGRNLFNLSGVHFIS